MFQKDSLPNGLRIITSPMSGVKSTTVLVLVGAGSRYEENENNGISHFAEHMFFKGTHERPTTFDISSTIDSVGGDFNAFTSKEYTGFYVKSASTHLDLALEVLADIILNSKFDSEEINRERGVILEEIKMYKDTPMRYVGTLFESLLYGDHPLGWDIAGRENTVRSIQREDFLHYLSLLYTPNNIIVCIGGDIEGKDVKSIIEKHFGSLKQRDIKNFEKISSIQAEPRVRLNFKETEQAHLALGVSAYPVDHPNRYPLAVLNTLLGGVMSSRLFISLRERQGLAYYVRSTVDEYLDTGNLSVQAGVRLDKIDESVKIILSEMARVANEEVSAVELNKAKENLKGKLILELEDSKEVSLLYSLQELLEKKIKSPEEIITKIDKVTTSAVLQVGKELFVSEKLNLAIIAPFKEESRFLEVLKF